jgi:zinc-ribbon domain
MYCPRCATQNIESARFCRSCGANLSLVPQALSGHLPEARKDGIEKVIRRIREPNLARGVRRVSVGFAFLVIVAVLFLRGAPGFGEIWLLIPAFLLLGKGIGEMVKVISKERDARHALMPVQTTVKLPPDPIYDPAAPSSITERTTRHLDTSAKS